MCRPAIYLSIYIGLPLSSKSDDWRRCRQLSYCWLILDILLFFRSSSLRFRRIGPQSWDVSFLLKHVDQPVSSFLLFSTTTTLDSTKPNSRRWQTKQKYIYKRGGIPTMERRRINTNNRIKFLHVPFYSPDSIERFRLEHASNICDRRIRFTCDK